MSFIAGTSAGLWLKGTMKRTIYIDGRKTGVSLEDAFWSILKEIAQAEDMTLSKMVTELDKTRQHGNLSSAIRLFVLDRVRSQKVGATIGYPLCLRCRGRMLLTCTEEQYPGYKRQAFECPACGGTMTQWAGVSSASD